jgi:hypothetical protein
MFVSCLTGSLVEGIADAFATCIRRYDRFFSVRFVSRQSDPLPSPVVLPRCCVHRRRAAGRDRTQTVSKPRGSRPSFLHVQPKKRWPRIPRRGPFGAAYLSPVHVIVQITPDFGTVHIGVGIWKFTNTSPWSITYIVLPSLLNTTSFVRCGPPRFSGFG